MTSHAQFSVSEPRAPHSTTSAEKYSLLLELGFVYDDCSVCRKWVAALCFCQSRIQLAVYNLVFCESFHSEECTRSRLVWQNFKILMNL